MSNVKVVIRNVRGEQDVYEYDNVVSVEQGAGAVSIKQSVAPETSTASGLVLYNKPGEKRTLIPWYRIESVVVQ